MNVQKTLAAALFGAGILVSGLAQAYTDLGTLSESPTQGNGGYLAGNYSFADEYKFNISTLSTVGAGVNEFNLFGYDLLSGWTVKLFNGAHALLDSNSVTGSSFSVSGTLGSGDYFVEIAGTTGPTGGAYSYSLTANPLPAPVPEPGELALMLSGLGLMGYMIRRRKNDVA